MAAAWARSATSSNVACLGLAKPDGSRFAMIACLPCIAPSISFDSPSSVARFSNAIFEIVSKGSESSHFIFWYEEERKAPDDGSPARYTQDEKVIVPLFEK